MTLVPPPQLPAEAILEVFVYPDDQDSALDPANPYSDSRRLEFLGRMLIKPAYLLAVCKRRPRIGGDELGDKAGVTLDRFMERNATAYQWHKRVRGYPDGVNPDSPDEARRLFCTFAGAVRVAFGYDVLAEWISDLVSDP